MRAAAPAQEEGNRYPAAASHRLSSSTPFGVVNPVSLADPTIAKVALEVRNTVDANPTEKRGTRRIFFRDGTSESELSSGVVVSKLQFGNYGNRFLRRSGLRYEPPVPYSTDGDDPWSARDHRRRRRHENAEHGRSPTERVRREPLD